MKPNNVRFLAAVLLMQLFLINPLFAKKGPATPRNELKIDHSWVVGNISCQMGNNLFQVAATLAYAWEHDVTPCFPGLAGDIPHLQHVFFRCNTQSPSSHLDKVWAEPSHKFHPIPFKNNVMLDGYFQSERYFVKYRNKLLDHFEPRKDDVDYIMTKYGHLLNHPKSVGIHLRWYFEDGAGAVFIQYGKDYLKKATAKFPKDSLFIVCSNNIEFAKINMPDNLSNVHYIENEPDYVDLYLLSLCKHNIITNSTFGWWGAWLNKHPEKIVIAPYTWLHPVNGPPTQDIVPKAWKKIKAK